MDTPSAVTRAAILLEKQPVTWRRAHGGYTPAERWLVDFADGSSCFVKAGVTPYTADALRASTTSSTRDSTRRSCRDSSPGKKTTCRCSCSRTSAPPTGHHPGPETRSTPSCIRSI